MVNKNNQNRFNGLPGYHPAHQKYLDAIALRIWQFNLKFETISIIRVPAGGAITFLRNYARQFERSSAQPITSGLF